MSKVINLVAPETVQIVQEKRSSTNKRHSYSKQVCAHCGQEIHQECGEIPIICGDKAFHEHHYSEYFEDQKYDYRLNLA